MPAPLGDAQFVRSSLAINRGDVARTKNWVMGQATLQRTDKMLNLWLQEQKLPADYQFTDLDEVVRTFDARLAFHSALWELVAAGALFPASGNVVTWNDPAFGLKSRGGATTVQLSASFPGDPH
jgi:hypothetical protein